MRGSFSIVPCILLLAGCSGKHPALPDKGLLLDLDAAKGVTTTDQGRVTAWKNQARTATDLTFVPQDEGRKEAGSGRPSVRRNIPELDGKPAIVFRQQELVCKNEDRFDGLTTGKGHTWIAVIMAHEQRVGLKDVNSFFGNLRNGGKYEGVWGGLNDDNTIWWGARNGRTFGRFDDNNPQLLGPILEGGRFHIVAGRMTAGTENATLSLYVNSPKATASRDFPVDPAANPSRMTVGQERDAIQHPGFESFDGEIARLLIWERRLDDAEFAATMRLLRELYLIR
jgi:hypothetical protein